MFIVIRKHWLWGAGLFGCFFVGLAAVLWWGHGPSAAPVFAAGEGTPVTVLIDAGHGGEDGGAVSAEGIPESRINLEVSRRLNDLLRFAGQRTVMVRPTEASIHTEGETIRARKVSDTHNRTALVNGTENGVLLSIHQNSLPSSAVTHGAYVFWNQEAGAEDLGKLIQESLNGTVNAGNEKQARRIPATVYLMNHVTAPGVLVECGFLSNAGEAQRLQEPAYQMRLASAIAAGWLRGLAGEEAP